MVAKYDEKSCGVLVFREEKGTEDSAKVPDTRQQENFDRTVLSGTGGSKFSDNAVDGTFAESSTRLFLLLHYPGGHWDLAKGHCEAGETEQETASRELFEETGIGEIEYIEGFREEVSYLYKKNRKLSHKQVVFFLAKTKMQNIQLSHEHHNFVWLPYEAALNKLTFENAQNLLRKAKKILEK